MMTQKSIWAEKQLNAKKTFIDCICLLNRFCYNVEAGKYNTVKHNCNLMLALHHLLLAKK